MLFESELLVRSLRILKVLADPNVRFHSLERVPTAWRCWKLKLLI